LAELKAVKSIHLKLARILNEIDPEFAGALTLTLIPGSPLFDDAESGRFEVITPFQSLKELKNMVDNSDFTACFFSSMHASNYLSVRGMLPQDKKRMVSELDNVLSKNDPALLRPESMRGL